MTPTSVSRPRPARPLGAPAGALLTALLLTALAAPAARAENASGLGVPSAQAAASLQKHALKGLDGHSLSLASLRGDVVVVNFWASWCAPCRRELPRLEMLNAEIARQGGRVLAVSIDSDRRNVELFAQRQGMHLPILLDGPEGLARELDLRSVPCTVVLNRAGDIAYVSSRSDAEGLDALAAATHKLLADRPVAAVATEGAAR